MAAEAVAVRAKTVAKAVSVAIVHVKVLVNASSAVTVRAKIAPVAMVRAVTAPVLDNVTTAARAAMATTRAAALATSPSTLATSPPAARTASECLARLTRAQPKRWAFLWTNV